MTWIYYFLWALAGTALGGYLGFLFGQKRPISYEEFRRIRDDGFNDAIGAAGSCLDDFAKCADNPKETARHAGLIRRLSKT